MTSSYSPRRRVLSGLAGLTSGLAIADLLSAEETDSSRQAAPGPRAPMTPASAKNVIMLFMEGGPGHMDTFDPKPQLQRRHKQESHLKGGLATGFKFFVGSPFGFRKVGDAGIEMCDQWNHLAAPDIASELCNYRGLQAESLNHPEALFQMNTGSRLGADPAIGAWATMGLGSENRNIPAYVVMTELALPQGGSGNWSNGFLPPQFRGTRLRSEGSPLLDLQPPEFRSVQQQRRLIDQLSRLNQQHAEQLDSDDQRLAARMESYELAFRMQAEVPDVLNLNSETAATRNLYGLDQPETATFGKQCLTARRLVEQGVRFVQIFSGGWDSHDYLERGHSARIRSVDRPMAGLIRDLKQRGMLDDTLVIWTGEFGRTPDNNKRGGVYSMGRGHNNQAMTLLMAGGGIRPGIHGATDEFGASAVDCVHPIRDFHVTLLHLLGLDDSRLTWFHAGRHKQLSQFGGEVIPELIS